MTNTNERLRRDQHPSVLAGTLVPLIIAAALAAIVIVMAYQHPAECAGDTNAGPSLQTVTPLPSTTELRPTQAPQP